MTLIHAHVRKRPPTVDSTTAVPYVVLTGVCLCWTLCLAGEEPAPQPPKPARTSFANAFPSGSIFFVETPDFARLRQRFASSPLGQLVDSSTVQGWWTKYKAGQLQDGERRTQEALAAFCASLDGCAAFGFGPPELVSAVDETPPAALAVQVRAEAAAHTLRLKSLRDRLAGQAEVQPRSAPDSFKLEEAGGTMLAERDGELLLAFQAKVFPVLFKGMHLTHADSLAKRVDGAWNEAGADLHVHLARKGLRELAAAGFVLEEDQVKTLDAAGFIEGSTLTGTVRIHEKGFHERYQLSLAKLPPESRGLLQVLAALPPIVQGGAEVIGEEGKTEPEALDALPRSATVWISLRGDLSAQADDFVLALRRLGPGAVGLLDSFQKFGGLAPAEALKQVRAPVELALIAQPLPGEDLPEHPPWEWLASILLKDPAPVAKVLDAMAVHPDSFVGMEDYRGGSLYAVKDDPKKGGWWLKANRLIFASTRKNLDLALAALERKVGNERLADRADIKVLFGGKDLDARKSVLLYADAAQALELPYALGKHFWGDDAKAGWPDYERLRPALGRILIQYGAPEAVGEGKAELTASTDMSLIGLLQFVRLPLGEAGW